MKPFSKIIGAWLEYSGKSQSEIAGELGVTRQHVNQHLSGERKYPTLRIVERYAGLFGVSVPDFLSGPPESELVSRNNS